jgi:hypothetical protein
VPCLLEGGDDAIERLRSLMGETDARKASAGTIRADFGTDIQANAVHGSDAPGAAREEIAFMAAKLGWKAAGLEAAPGAEAARGSGGSPGTGTG